ncbi:MAG: hypothetical protein EKK60_15495 [Gordonia sp. (in: high G+C Gram-positive bacteria)]|nr:MAG: hypothetical protein EKK60_15495 [Gordonia sp. (in: high G+C Gram-positive bacteria)]
MAAGTFTLYDSVAELIADGTIDLDGDTFKLALLTSSYTPNAAHDEYADLTNELSTANGYTSGGATLGSVTWNRSSGVATFDSADVVWTASSSGITARYAVLYDDTSSGKKLIGYMLLDSTPANVTATAGNTLTVAPHSTQGWFQLTVNPA